MNLVHESTTKFHEKCSAYFAAVIRDLKEVSTGMNMTVKQADGTVVEYVEHNNEY